MQLPTRQVRIKATGSIANINVRDFDPGLHEEPGPPPPAAEAPRPAPARPAPRPRRPLEGGQP